MGLRAVVRVEEARFVSREIDVEGSRRPLCLGTDERGGVRLGTGRGDRLGDAERVAGHEPLRACRRERSARVVAVTDEEDVEIGRHRV
jgi:hypothetical protein